MNQIPDKSNIQLFIFTELSKANVHCIERHETGEVAYPLAKDNWGYSKHDGWRIQLHSSPDEIRLFTVSGKDFSRQFAGFAHAVHPQISHAGVILDIELVGYSKSGEHVSPRSIRAAEQHVGFALDILYLNGRDTTTLPTTQRIRILQEFMTALPKGVLRCAEFQYITNENEWIKLWQQTVKRFHQGFDGVIIKLSEATYFEKAIKVKQEEHIDVSVVGAFRKKNNELINSLLLAAYSENEKLWIPVTQVTPDKADGWSEIVDACQEHILSVDPAWLKTPPQIPDFWFAPEVVLEVALTEWRDSKHYPVGKDRVKKYWLRAEKGSAQTTRFEQIGEIEKWSQIQSREQNNRPSATQLTLFGDTLLETTEPRRVYRHRLRQHEGFMVAIEGIDGVGKGTQAKLLCERLRDDGLNAVLHSFPQYSTFFGSLIQDMLDGKLGNPSRLPPVLSALPFAMDRWLARQKLKDAISNGCIVICDRYTASNAVYQASHTDDFEQANRLVEWIFQLEFEVMELPRPDLTILLSADRSMSKDFLNSRSERSHQLQLDLYETNDSLQNTASRLYQSLAESSDWHVVNFMGSNQQARDRQDIADEIFDLVSSAYSR